MKLVGVFGTACKAGDIHGWHPALTPGVFAAENSPRERGSIDVDVTGIHADYCALTTGCIVGCKIGDICLVVIVIRDARVRVDEIVKVGDKRRLRRIDAVVVRADLGNRDGNRGTPEEGDKRNIAYESSRHRDKTNGQGQPETPIGLAHLLTKHKHS